MPPLVVLVGETASGKSALGIEIAERFDGEIICADSRTVYRGMDIGTAKPTDEDKKRVPHHVLDVVEPTSIFNVAQFKQLATDAIQDISRRGKLPIMVGGTGLYVDSVLYDFQFRQVAEPTERARLEALSVTDLQTEIAERGLSLPENEQNPRHLIRVLETGGAAGGRSELRANTLVLGLSVDRDVLYSRIAARVDAMLEAGFIGEVQQLEQRYGLDAPGLQAPGYKAFRKYLSGEVDLEQAREEFIRNDMNLAKRQRTWFRRNKSIRWVNDRSKIVGLVTTFLNKTN